MSEHYRPLHVRKGVLTFGSRATFRPEGLAVRPTNAAARMLSWDEVARPGRDGGWNPSTAGRSDYWLLLPRLLIRGGFARGRLTLSVADPFVDEWRTLAVVWPFVEYLRDTPAARAGLADPARVTTVVRVLRSGKWSRPREVLPFSRRYDVNLAVVLALASLWPRPYADRPVAGDPMPDEADVVAAVRGMTGTRYSDEEIAALYRTHSAMTPWPFSVLL